MFSQGINPELNLENVKEITEVCERCTKMTVDPRHPYAGKLVFTAFSGSHQDAISKGIHTTGRHGKNVITKLWQDPGEENLAIAREIQLYLQSGVRPGDIAVLYRTNAGPRFLMEKLMEYNLPFRTRDTVPNLYEHWISRNILTYIRIAMGSRAREDILQVINRPKR